MCVCVCIIYPIGISWFRTTPYSNTIGFSYCQDLRSRKQQQLVPIYLFWLINAFISDKRFGFIYYRNWHERSVISQQYFSNYGELVRKNTAHKLFSWVHADTTSCSFTKWVGHLFDVHRPVHRNITSVTNQPDAPLYQIYFILEWHSTCFGRSFRPSLGVQDCTYSNRYLSNRYSLTAC